MAEIQAEGIICVHQKWYKYKEVESVRGIIEEANLANLFAK